MAERIFTITEPELITESQIEALCAELHALGLKRAQGSSWAVDTAEWRAARLIRILILGKRL